MVSVPFVAAQEDNGKQTDAQLTAKYFADTHGAQVRFMQLDRSLSNNKIAGEKVLSYIEENYPEANDTELVALREQINDLLDQAKEISVTNQTKDEVIAQFQALKETATNLTAQFREQAHALLSDDDLSALREEIRASVKENNEQYRAQIHKQVRSANANRFGKVLEHVPVEGAKEIQTQLANGEITREEAISQFKELVKNLPKEDRKHMAVQAKEYRMKGAVARQKMMGRLSPEKVDAISARIQTRLQERFGDDVPENVQEHVDKMIDHLNDVASNNTDGNASEDTCPMGGTGSGSCGMGN